MTENSRVTAALIQKFWDTTLEKQVEGQDIFTNYRGEIKADGNLPNAIIAVSKQTGKTTGSVGLVKSLSGSGQTGRTGLSGNEEQLEILDFTMFANEFKHGVNVDAFGIDAVANSPYKILEMAGPMLAEYMEKFKGTHRREALCQRFSSNTTVAPSSTTQHINSNLFVAGVAIASQPAYSEVLATYKTAINAAIPNAPAQGDNTMTPAVLKELGYWSTNIKRLRPMDDGMLVLTVPANQKRVLMDENNGLLSTFNTSSQPEKALIGWFGRYEKFHLVEDLRSPMVTTAGATDIIFTYTTVDDSRPAAGQDSWDVGFVLAKGAIAELELERLHFERDLTVEYGRESRLGAFGNYGDQIIEYLDGSTRINQGSAIVLYNSFV